MKRQVLPRCSSLMTMRLRVRPCRGRAPQRWTQLSGRFCNRPPIKGVRVRSDPILKEPNQSTQNCTEALWAIVLAYRGNEFFRRP
jgi:hypothetical protein